MKKKFLFLFAGTAIHLAGFSQALDITAVLVSLDFSRTLQEWDGFGFNYVETAHSPDMKEFNQEYGGFSQDKIQEKYKDLGAQTVEEGMLVFDAPAGSVTTFYSK
jgi:hypothetical protein